MIEHVINDKKVQIYDNVLSEKIIKKWINFYETSATFSLACKDSNKIGSSIDFFIPLSLRERIEVFEIDTWLESYIKNFDPAYSLRHFNRSYINVFTKNDTHEGHADSTSPYLACLLFLNPYVENTKDSGFYIEDLHIENIFNRMILFDGRLFHKAQPPSDDLIRLTLYFGFNLAKIKNSFQTEISHNKNNSWFKSVKSL